MSRIPRSAWAIAALATPLHLALALSTDLSPDEAYYLAAARLGRPIVDHPPLLIWLLGLSDRWAWAPVELRVRVWPIALSLGTSLAWIALARARGAGPRGCVMAAWIGAWALLPTAGGFVATPDGPLLLTVTLALLLLPRHAAGAALMLSLGALAKVTALPVAALLALSREPRRPARLALALAPLLALPWLAASLGFQMHHAFAQRGPAGWSVLGAAGALAATVGAQLALWSPLVVWYGARALRELPRGDRALALGRGALLVVSAIVRSVPPEPNWWAPVAIVVVVAFARAADALGPRLRLVTLASILLPTLVAAAHVARPFLPLAEAADPTARLHGWSQGRGPVGAPGVGSYGAAAESCVYKQDCSEIMSHFIKMDVHE